MSMIANKTDLRGRRWIRCPECGDSKKHSWKAHCLVDDAGRTYCFLCGHSTSLDIEAMLAIALGDQTVEEAMDSAAEALRNPAEVWSRGTVLDQYEIEGRPGWVSYAMRDCNGRRIGWHNRNIHVKQSENEGRRGIGYARSTLVSTPSTPLIVVEGPMDVIAERYVCVFGTITKSVGRHFRMQYCWLFPDPDQIDTRSKRDWFARRVVKPMVEDGMVIVQGVIVGNGDPDVATKLVHVSVEELDEWLI